MSTPVQVIHARVPSANVEQLRAHALANDRTLAQEVRRALRMYGAMLERQDRTAVQNGGSGSARLELEPIPPA
jgi:hypothetical protein